ncbi:MAG TPA: formyltransferase family protein [Gemmatimonadales bacterium]|nr:formyltransferase family protein [Gemmatimonadales bacterium]
MSVLRVVIAAEEAAGARALRLLATTPHCVVAVLSAGLAELAARLGHVAWSPSRVKDPAFATTLRAHEVDLLLNVHSLCVVHGDVVRALRLGGFNLHPGPLPGYRGLNAPSWAIYEGERAHAVTLHWMNDGIDTGAIAYVAPVPITPDDTGLTLSAKCVRAGLPLVATLLEAASHSAGDIPRAPQPVGAGRYFGRGAPRGGEIDWSERAQRVTDFVRAADYAPFPSPWATPWTRLPNGVTVALSRVVRTGRPVEDVHPGTVGEALRGGVLVAAADEWVQVDRARLGDRDVEPMAVLPRGERLGVGSPTTRLATRVRTRESPHRGRWPPPRARRS